MRFSIIIPLFNRPDEIRELLDSLCVQDFEGISTDTEVIIVEDGSQLDSRAVVEGFKHRLQIKYLVKGNEGPALARNFGVLESTGEWLLFLDSDVVLPVGWLSAVADGVSSQSVDMFGGADRASDDFSPVQKAINYSMTSFFTTGGIRGGKKSVEKFHPRSFNMGVRRSFFEMVGGFSAMRFGEDIDLSIRLMGAGARTTLLLDAWVYHKRRVDFRKFYRQVRASGVARVWLSRRHKGSLRLVHLMPLCFVVFVVLSVVAGYWTQWAGLPMGIFLGGICVDSTVRNKGVEIGVLSVVASFIQLWGYGVGFLRGWIFGGRGVERKFYK